MINLFNINNYVIDTSKYENLLHGKIVNDFENKILEYVGAKYAVTFNSATSAIFLIFSQYKNLKINVPSMVPPVVINAIITSGNDYLFYDDVNWIGDSYILHKFEDYKIVDSAQKLEKNQFEKECNPQDLMIFSFYPTKPIGSCDGGMIVSNDEKKINHLRELALNGMSYSENNWDRKIKFPGYKMYMNSLQADIALQNFSLYEKKLSRLKSVRDFYNQNLNCENSSSHLYRINVKNRNYFIEYMKKNNVSCGIHYEAMHLNSVYKKINTFCPLSEEVSKTTVSIPFHEKLSVDELNQIIKLIKNYENKNF